MMEEITRLVSEAQAEPWQRAALGFLIVTLGAAIWFRKARQRKYRNLPRNRFGALFVTLSKATPREWMCILFTAGGFFGIVALEILLFVWLYEK